jgi:hypothetical protein
MNQRGHTQTAGGASQTLPGAVFERLKRNIAASDRDPTKSMVGFALSWIAFFFIFYVMPTPEGFS